MSATKKLFSNEIGWVVWPSKVRVNVPSFVSSEKCQGLDLVAHRAVEVFEFAAADGPGPRRVDVAGEGPGGRVTSVAGPVVTFGRGIGEKTATSFLPLSAA